jgi:hypothetical protein
MVLFIINNINSDKWYYVPAMNGLGGYNSGARYKIYRWGDNFVDIQFETNCNRDYTASLYKIPLAK